MVESLAPSSRQGRGGSSLPEPEEPEGAGEDEGRGEGEEGSPGAGAEETRNEALHPDTYHKFSVEIKPFNLTPQSSHFFWIK